MSSHLVGQLNVGRFFFIRLGVEVRSAEIYHQNLGPILIGRIPARLDTVASFELRGSHAKNHPQRFEWWRWREDRILASYANLSRNEAAPEIRVLIVPFIDLNPSNGYGYAPNARPSFVDRSQFPYTFADVVRLDNVPRQEEAQCWRRRICHPVCQVVRRTSLRNSEKEISIHLVDDDQTLLPRQKMKQSQRSSRLPRRCRPS